MPVARCFTCMAARPQSRTCGSHSLYHYTSTPQAGIPSGPTLLQSSCKIRLKRTVTPLAFVRHTHRYGHQRRQAPPRGRDIPQTDSTEHRLTRTVPDSYLAPRHSLRSVTPVTSPEPQLQNVSKSDYPAVVRVLPHWQSGTAVTDSEIIMATRTASGQSGLPASSTAGAAAAVSQQAVPPWPVGRDSESKQYLPGIPPPQLKFTPKLTRLTAVSL